MEDPSNTESVSLDSGNTIPTSIIDLPKLDEINVAADELIQINADRIAKRKERNGKYWIIKFFIYTGLLFGVSYLFYYIGLYRLNDYVIQESASGTYIVSVTRHILYNMPWIIVALFIPGIIRFVIQLTLKKKRTKSARRLKLATSFFPGILKTSIIIFLAFFISWIGLLASYYHETVLAKTQIVSDFASGKITQDANELKGFISQDNLPLISLNDDIVSAGIVRFWIEQNGNNKSTFYLDVIGDDIPSYLYPALSIENTKTFLFDNRLYINEVDEKVGEVLLSPLARIVVDKKFPQTASKTGPNVDFIGTAEYQEYRKKELAALKVDWEEYIQQLEGLIQQYEDRAKEELDLYNDTGYAMWKTWAESDQQYADECKTRLQNAKLILENIETYAGNLSYELGVYSPADGIKILYADQEKYPPAKYLKTLIHEYLHFVSDKESISLDAFFEEGLTEYFTGEIMNDNFPSSTLSPSYPQTQPVIEEIVKDLSEEKAIEFYYSKDQTKLTGELDTLYGAGFYEEHRAELNQVVNVSGTTSEQIATKVLELIE